MDMADGFIRQIEPPKTRQIRVDSSKLEPRVFPVTARNALVATHPCEPYECPCEFCVEEL